MLQCLTSIMTAEMYAFAGNVRHLQVLLAAATKLGAFLQPHTAATGNGGQSGCEARAMTVNDFLFAAGLDHINMFSLTR